MKMRSFQVCQCGAPLQMNEAEAPQPQGTQVLLRMLAAGDGLGRAARLRERLGEPDRGLSVIGAALERLLVRLGGPRSRQATC